MQLLTFDDLRALEVLEHSTVVGDSSPHHGIAAVEVLESHEVLDKPLAPRSAVLVCLDESLDRHRQHLLDLLLRRAHQARAGAIIVLGSTGEIPAATRSLATKLAIPVLLAPAGSSPLTTAVELRSAVLEPELAMSNCLLSVTRQLSSGPRNPQELCHLVGKPIRANVGICTAQGVFIAGGPLETPVTQLIGGHIPESFHHGDRSIAVTPIIGSGQLPVLWSIAERAGGGPFWRELALHALALARGEITAWLAREQLSTERDARVRTTLLTEIVEHGNAIPESIEQQAVSVGWQLLGWHTGVHLTFSASTPMSTLAIETLNTDLAKPPLSLGPLVERANGWSAWTTTQDQPGPEHARTLARELESRLRQLTAHYPGLTCAAGVGAAQRDISGIATTLSQARQAASVASADRSPITVRAVQDLGASRLLLGWYASGAFHDYARQLLAPLLEAAEPELRTTLETYLDRACSAMHTSRVLGIHRNTVSLRISRIETLLGASLTDADTRLTLQLALRALRAGSAADTER
ncbi:PucR family transcriptional regulator [Sciscionella marina]|uniref:PucR family transcriptional regulator n=1 Tax=Sciscionella marina TaxID=508770 RepID=UPI0003A39A12|nr:helix-turn-helix domain-containing protein [Sciscionella marina]